jgi:serine/threonine protein kinase
MVESLVSPREEFVEINLEELRLGDRIGSGCTAEVFVGEYRGQQVAIKQIAWNKASAQKANQRAFDREVAIMTKVRHPNLVGLIGITSLKPPLQVVTEFCSGGCCFELLHNQEDVNLDMWQQVKMCKDVALAMQYLHAFQPPIIHRDLKSLNLLLARPVTGTTDIPFVKVSDFGLARMKDTAGTEWGKMTIAAGTCHWMAPEVFSGGNYDLKVDVYSYSMILFEIVCREIPFEDAEPAEVGRFVLEGQRPDLEAIPPDCPDPLSNLMQHCWQAAADRRPTFDVVVSVVTSVMQLYRTDL